MSHSIQTQLHSGNGDSGEVPLIHNDETWEADGVEDNIQILIIDDEPETVEEISEKLELHGFRCVVATDAKSGLELIHSKASISVVLADIRMPGMDGLELCKTIRNEISAERELALLVMTGHAGLSEAIEALKVGALDFLTKPLSPYFLVHAVKRADQHIKARLLERDFKEQLKALVEKKTGDLQQKARELEKSNAALAISNQVKDEFLMMVSHELRTPLNAIVGFSGIIEHSIENPVQREFVGKIKDAGWRLTEMVNSMIDMVAVETKALQLNFTDVNVSEVIEKAVSAYQGKAMRAGITINTNNISASSANLDPVRISQAVGRLVDNAISFSPTGGMVQISAQQTDDALTISVQDDGVGMTEQEITKALEPLRQIDSSTTKKHSGIGAGLFLAKMFAELHGGTLLIESVPNQGTSATIEIPKAGLGKC